MLVLEINPLSEDCLNESLLSSEAGTQKRRSTRIVQAVPITVTGVDALGQPFKERTTTVMVNCHGCKYQSKHYVPKNSIVTLEIPRPQVSLPARSVQGRVVWVQRPRTVRELFQIGLEFEVAGNVWGIAFPPEDWFPYPDEAGAEIPAPSESAGTGETQPGTYAQESQASLAPSVPAPAPPAQAAPSAESKIHVVPPPAPPSSQEAQLALARQMAKMVTDAKENLDKSLRKGAETAIAEEMTVVRQQLDAQLHEAVEHAIKVSMERVSESAVKKVVQEAADRTATIVDQARKAGEVSAEQLDAKVRQAVEAAVSGAAENAARQAAEQTATLNLKQSVEQAVERALTEREARTPSLEILSSPEAAQKHLDNWRKDLEDAAQGVRAQTVDQARADIAGASERWQQEFQAALSGATQKLGETLSEVSQVALTQAEKDIAARSSSLRASLDEAIAGAQSTIGSLGAGIETQRARAEETKAELQEAARTTLEQTRQRLEEVLAAQYQEIGRKADQVIADRAQQIEPTLEAAAQKVAERLSGQLDQTLAEKLGQAQKTVSELADAEQQAARAQSLIQEQVQQAQVRAEQIQERLQAQVQQASDQAVQESLDRLRQESAKIPAEAEQKSREVVAKIEAELEQKRVETEHTTYEALLKASEWYQKKAHTTMQSTLEKAVEQSTTALRDRAAEISSLLASELDHYRRTYVEHSQAQIEEAAKEVVERERGLLHQTADQATGNFADQVHRITGESLRRFEFVSRDALEKARSDMEYNREGSLAEFQQRLDERLQDGIEAARDQLQAQLLPLMQSWDAQRESQQREWMEQLKKSTDESIDQYKARLENASNSWLLASATTLGQHSQTVLDTIAKAAEKRLRDTCADVLAGMGDTLKQRLLGLSSDLGAEEDDPQKRKK